MPPPVNPVWPAELDTFATVPKNVGAAQLNWNTGGVGPYADVLPFIDEFNKTRAAIQLLQGANRGDLCVTYHGAKPDATWITVSTTAGSNVVTTSTDTFTADDVGKSISIDGAYQAPADLSTTVAAYVDARTLQLSTAAQDHAHRRTGTIGTFPTARDLTELNISNGSTYVVAGSDQFESGDVGKAFVMSQGLRISRPLDAKITGYTNARRVTIDRNAVATVTNTSALYGTNNAEPIQEAITAAIAQGRRLLLPFGNMIVDFRYTSEVANDGRSIRGLMLTPDADTGRKNLWLAGAGKGMTRLIHFPRQIGMSTDPGAFDTRMFYGRTVDAQYLFEDFSVIGPSTITYSGQNFGQPQELQSRNIAFYHHPQFLADGTAVSSPNFGTENAFRFERVAAKGFWRSVFIAYDCDGLFSFVDFDTEAWADTFQFYDNIHSANRKVYAQGGKWTGGSVNHEEGGTGSIFYSGNNAGPMLDGVEVTDNWRCAFRFTSSGVYKGPAPLAYISNCFFNIQAGNHIQTSGDPIVPYLINNCWFGRDGMIAAQSHTSLTNCVIKGKIGISQEDQDTGGYNVTLTNCRLFCDYPAPIINPSQYMSVILENCDIYFKEAANAYQTGATTASGIITAGGTLTRLDNCRVYSPDVQVGFLVAAQATGATRRDVEIDDCLLSGLCQGALLVNGDGNATGVRVSVKDSRLALTGGGLAASINNCAAGVVTWQGTEWGSALPSVGGPTVGAQFMHPREGFALTPIASAGTMTLSKDANTFAVTGTAQINNIHFWADAPQLFTGAIIRYIADEGWNLGTGGNIVPRTTTARSVGEVVTLMYDGRSGNLKWREV